MLAPDVGSIRRRLDRGWPCALRSRRTVTVLLVLTMLVLAGCGGATDGSQAPASGDSAPAGDDGAPAGGAGDGGAGSVGSFYAADGDRVVVREARLALRVAEFDQAFRELRRVAQRYGGYVGDRDRESRGEWAEGTVTLKVPPENFSAARDGVAGAGHLESEDVSVLDFTARADEREARLAERRQEEAALEDLLNRTDDVDESRQVRSDLADVREEIRQLEREQARLSRRAAMSTITVELHEPVGEKPPRNYRSSFGFGDAFLEAFYGGLAVLKYVIVFFGYVVPIGLAMLPLAAFGLSLVTVWRQSRRLAGRWLRATSPPQRGSGQRDATTGDGDLFNDDRSAGPEDGSEPDPGDGYDDGNGPDTEAGSDDGSGTAGRSDSKDDVESGEKTS